MEKSDELSDRVGFTSDPILSVLCLMMFGLRLAECRLQLDLTGHDPNPPQEVWQQEPAPRNWTTASSLSLTLSS